MVNPQFKFAQLLLALRRVIRNDHLVLMVLALVVGCASGAAVVLFREAIDLVQMAVYGTDHDRLSMHVARLPWWQVLLAPAAGGLVVGLLATLGLGLSTIIVGTLTWGVFIALDLGIAPIRLATPTTDDKRLPAVVEGSEGFLYYVAVAGITGMQQAAIESIEANVTRIKRSTDIPVAVGFGVRTPEQAGEIARVADGVVVGSALVELVAEHGADAPAKLRELTAGLAKAVHSAAKGAA